MTAPQKNHLHDEGYIKFHCIWQKQPACNTNDTHALLQWRQTLYSKNLIGVYASGIGFGNVSTRAQTPDHFLITGSATGGIAFITNNHISCVTACDIANNTITCVGPIKASSESLSHAVLYEQSSEINAVIHIHHLPLWRNLLNKIPTTRAHIPYGTPEMAYEIARLYTETNLPHKKIFVMGGHEEGIMSSGSTLAEAGNILMDHLHALERT